MIPRRPGLLTAVVAVAWLGACGGDAPEAPTIADQTFARRAEQLCARELPPLRADLADDETREPAEVAPTVVARADSLDQMVAGLRDVPVAPGDRAAVNEWLDDWDAYVQVGRRYAAALKDGDPDRYSAVADEGLEPQRRISAFARANGFDSCALDGVPLPPREGL